MDDIGGSITLNDHVTTTPELSSSGQLGKSQSKKDVRDTVEHIKKMGTKVGRGAVSRLFYALSLVKKRMLEFGMEGTVEAELEVAMFKYNIEVEINNEENCVEDEINYLKELENEKEKEKENNKDNKDTSLKNKEAKYSFIKKAIGRFMVTFRDHMILMAEKMHKKKMKGTVGLGMGIGLGPIGSIGIQPKIEISSLMEWQKKQKEIEKQRVNGKLTVKLISGKHLKKGHCQVVFRLGEEKRESPHVKSYDPKWEETFDSMPCAPLGEELAIEVLHKNKNVGKKLVEEVFVNLEKMKLENNIPKVVDITLITNGTLQIEFLYSGKDISNFDGSLKIECLEGKKLAKKDISGKSDPYLIFFAGKIKSNKVNTKSKNNVKTKYINQTLNPVWNETVNLNLPTFNDGFTVFCYDYDMTGDHDFMGKVFIPLTDLKPNSALEKWFDLDTEGKIKLKYTYLPNNK